MKKIYKKKIVINEEVYSTNDAKKKLSNLLKNENFDVNKRCKIVNLLSKRENEKFNIIVDGDLYVFEIVLFNQQNKWRCNNYGENICDKRNKIFNKINKANILLHEIFENQQLVSQLINNSANRIKMFDYSFDHNSIFNKSLYPMWAGNNKFKFKVDKEKRYIELHIFDGNIYRVNLPILTNDIKEIEFIINNLEQIKEYLNNIYKN